MSVRVPAREAERRLALQKAAFREVAEKGFADVTLDDIARRAGVSKGVTLYYFASKEDLFRSLFAWLVESIHSRMREAIASQGDPVEKLRALVAITFPSPSKNRAFFRAFVDFSGIAARREGFREVTALFYRGCREIDGSIVDHGIRRGAFVIRDRDAAASTMRAIFDGLMMQWLAEEDPEASFSDYRERCERELLAYLAPGRATGSGERAERPAAAPSAIQSPAS